MSKSDKIMAERLVSEIVGFAMIFGLVSAASAPLLYFVNSEIDSANNANESIIGQKISRIAESLRVIRTYDVLESTTPSLGIEVVNTGFSNIRITGIHYLVSEQVISENGCATMTKVRSQQNVDACTIETNVITDMHFTPKLANKTHNSIGIIITTTAGNVFTLVEHE